MLEALFAALQTHLGVRFVTEATATEPTLAIALDPERSREIAKKIFAAVAIGDVTALESLARELTSGSPQEAGLGQRLTRLVSGFDFDGLRQVAISLTRPEGAGDGQ